jgi:hypothetical protein
MKPRFPLSDPEPLQFRQWDKRLYFAIQDDPNAKIAFDKLVGGSKPIGASELLLVVGAVTSAQDPPRQHEKEDAWLPAWNDKWEGLHSVAGSLRLAARKMEKHLARSPDGPAPWAYMGAERWQTGATVRARSVRALGA